MSLTIFAVLACLGANAALWLLDAVCRIERCRDGNCLRCWRHAWRRP